MTRSATWLFALASFTALVSGCVVRAAAPPPGPVYYPPQPTVVVQDDAIFVPNAPPPPQQEFIPMAPGPNHYWVRGYWNWDGYQWAWIPGIGNTLRRVTSTLNPPM
jgi:hypothetical protein